jgi:hypothetical protein
MTGLNGLWTSSSLAEALDRLRAQIEKEPATTFSDDRVFLASQQLAEVLEHQIQAAEHVRGLRTHRSR